MNRLEGSTVKRYELEPFQFVGLRKGRPTTTTIAIAAGTGNSHGAVIKLVRNYESDLKEFGLVGFEIAPRLKEQHGGGNTEFAILNEPQTTLIMSYMKNTPIIRVFKKKLVREFYRMALTLRNKESADTLEARRLGKIPRRQETETIRRFVDYAKSSGSKNPTRYYVNFTTMAYRALNLVEQTAPLSLRDTASTMELTFLAGAEYLIEEMIEAGMAARVPYKEIFQTAKEGISVYASTLPRLRQISLQGEFL